MTIFAREYAAGELVVHARVRQGHRGDGLEQPPDPPDVEWLRVEVDGRVIDVDEQHGVFAACVGEANVERLYEEIDEELVRLAAEEHME